MVEKQVWAYGKPENMMKKSITVAISFSLGISVLAYVMRPLTEEQLQQTSQLMVVGTLTKVRELSETNSTIWSGSCKLRGLEATFAVSKVFKGAFTNSTLVLHYYRWDTPFPTSDEGSAFGPDVDAPNLIFLKPSDTNQFILYLVGDGASRYAPASGQLYYAYESVRAITEK